MFKFLKNPEIRRKVLFTLFVIFVFRVLAHVPVPGVDPTAIRNFLTGNSFLGIFDLFSGGGLQNFSVVTLGLGPYINASIIIQLFTVMFPKLEEMQKEGEAGQEKINMYTRLITVPIALLQSYGVYFLLSNQKLISTLNTIQLIILILTLTAGTMLAMWIGELVTEYGVGNGISLLIFVGIISRLPVSVAQLGTTISSQNVFNLLVFVVVSLLVVAGVVLVNEGTRNIPLEYGRTGVKSQKVTNYLPIKINQAGVIPIIFAVSVVMIPNLLAGPMVASANIALQNVGRFLSTNFSANSVAYNVLYFALVVGFTYFYTSVQFNPEKIADDVKKRGGFIPGIRPGLATKKYLGGVVSKITLAGALFLGVIAILPYLMRNFEGSTVMSVGGTSLLIVVSVVLETIRQIQSMMVTRNYQSFLD